MCICKTQLTMSYKSLNDSPSKFYLEGRKTFLKFKREKNLISEELFNKALNFIEKKQVFDIIECIGCKEIVDINDTSDYVQLIKKSVDSFDMDSVKKGKGEVTGEVTDETTGEVTGEVKRVKRAKKIREHSREGGKQKRIISDEVREARRQRMKKMWEERRKSTK